MPKVDDSILQQCPMPYTAVLLDADDSIGITYTCFVRNDTWLKPTAFMLYMYAPSAFSVTANIIVPQHTTICFDMNDLYQYTSHAIPFQNIFLPMYHSHLTISIWTAWCYSIPQLNVQLKCQLLSLNICRHLIRRHEFSHKIWCFFYSLHCMYLLFGQPLFIIISNIVSKILSFQKRYLSSTVFAPQQISAKHTASEPVGGGRSYLFPALAILPYASGHNNNIDESCSFKYVDHIPKSEQPLHQLSHSFVCTQISLMKLIPNIPVQSARKIAKIHNIIIPFNVAKDLLPSYFEHHNCVNCNLYFSVFVAVENEIKRIRAYQSSEKYKQKRRSRYAMQKEQVSFDNGISIDPPIFPPPALMPDLSHQVISNFCRDSSPDQFQEAGCAVCGSLIPLKLLRPLTNISGFLKILEVSGVTRSERKTTSDTICEINGPVLDRRCSQVCETCRVSLRRGKVPRLALANGFWLGDIPEVLSDLRFVEKLLIARIRHNCCFVRVASGGRKLISHVVAFESPIPKVYHALPPPIEDLNETLAILFTGPCKPTDKDFTRTPLLVRRNNVVRALEWLKLNHANYADLEISHENLSKYPEDSPPVSITYQIKTTNKVPEGTSVFDADIEDGTEEGDCPFVVHGLYGEHLDTKSSNELKAIALQHLNKGGKVLAIGHASQPESIYKNPELYPQIFPWLFPYGLGGIGTTSISETEHKRHLLMFHDKRFQLDINFPFVAFSHEQIKASTTGAFLLTNTDKFYDITNRLLGVDQTTLGNLTKRLSEGEYVKPVTEAEKECYQIIRDLDHVSGKVSGSITSKKYMRNEIWSLIIDQGTPSWYITLSPADVKHPLALYFADTGEEFRPEIQSYDKRIRLIANNPVASARFFHFMVQLFIKHVLGVGTEHPGIYGNTSAYYGTVEQQGRLTLHLHLLLWIRGCLSPQEIRRQILDPTSDFQQKIIEYLESCHIGEFITGSKDEVISQVQQATETEGYIDPTETLPEAPPMPCRDNCTACLQCKKLKTWWNKFDMTVDDILSKSNIHHCMTNLNRDGSQNKARQYKGCLNNPWGTCKARFPRSVFKKTEVDPETGAISMKKLEPMINTVTPLVSYLFRCNTDVTSLKSGTAIKGVILYVSDYITKVSLKTHVIFDTIRELFQRNSEMIGGTATQQEKARRLMTKIVNTLSAKMEIGAPMACMYLLKNPDHYTSHKFAVFYWQSYVREAQSVWQSTSDNECSDKVVLLKCHGRVVGLSPVYDYIYRPHKLEAMCLYDWIRRCHRVKLSKSEIETLKEAFTDDKIEELYASSESTNLSDCDDLSDISYISHETGQAFEHDESSKCIMAGTYLFTEIHPLYDSHGTRCVPMEKSLVPNFVGAVLPRRDQGDHEYYCLTMLTLFKPWRSGFDLKPKNEIWDDTFRSHKFTQQQIQLMDNFNLRYECLDARDDFHAQLRKHSTGIPSWVSENDILQDEEVDVGCDVTAELTTANATTLLGKKYQKQCQEIESMRSIMQNLGWTDGQPDLLPDGLNIQPEALEITQTASQWKASVQKLRQETLEQRVQNITASDENLTRTNFIEGQVRIIDKSYLEQHCCAITYPGVIQEVKNNFGLNREQERSFRIVAIHASNPQSDQLKMYVGGMGGTGKTQVIKALMEFFKMRNEAHRFVIVAPTGSAAALLGGSTYHYMFGINESTGNRVSSNQSAQIRSRLSGVEYIFLDEVSMLSCRDMYRISMTLATVLNRPDMPFGGLNMIFSGDFAQLPPAIGGESTSLYSRTVGTFGSLLADQEAAIGKALWHQITTVVILRENMRQKTQSTEDSKLRTALENMRYKACTLDDIAFLNTKISSHTLGRKSVADQKFRHVSIITALNLHKDEINRLGAIRFAQETNQKLTHFYSIDTISSQVDTKKQKKFGPGKSNVSFISDSLQETLWNQPNSSNSKKIPAKLSLCFGMPVMLRNNVATELCMTKGQEGTVYAWHESQGPRGQPILEVLFVKLTNPPQPVKFDNLPENVIPLTRTSNYTICNLPDDTTLGINRNQVEVLQNFAMTDFSSQGKNRVTNVVHLTNCRTHQACYTALSRGSSANGTLILQGIHPGKITGGASGALRQEFRELELLDAIVHLRYEGKLPTSVYGDRRSTLINTFRQTMGNDYIPSHIHKAIQWGKHDPFLDQSVEDEPWQILSKKNFGKSQPSTHVLKNLPTIIPKTKRKLSVTQMESHQQHPKKRVKKDKQQVSTMHTQTLALPTPKVTSWSNNSCAYDAVLSVLHNIWQDNPQTQSVAFRELNLEFLGQLAKGFLMHHDGIVSLEHVRDSARQQLIPQGFRWGAYTSVHSILRIWLKSRFPVLSSHLACRGGHRLNRMQWYTDNCIIGPGLNPAKSIQDHVRCLESDTPNSCTICNESVVRKFTFKQAPAILSFDLSDSLNEEQTRIPTFNSSITIEVNNQTFVYKLRGILYYGNGHFTSRIVTSTGHIWFHDGISTGSSTEYEGTLTSIHNLAICRSRVATAAIYAGYT
jgi:hypothetical protein